MCFFPFGIGSSSSRTDACSHPHLVVLSMNEPELSISYSLGQVDCTSRTSRGRWIASCAPGHYCPPKSAAPTKCSAGTYADAAGRSATSAWRGRRRRRRAPPRRAATGRACATARRAPIAPTRAPARSAARACMGLCVLTGLAHHKSPWSVNARARQRARIA